MRVCMVGCRWFADDLENYAALGFEELFRIAGKNSGNLFIGEAVRAHLKRLFPQITAMEYFSLPDVRETPGESVADRYDLIVMSASNMLSPKGDFGVLAKFVEATRLPLLVFGLGAQAEASSERFDLLKGTKRLLDYAVDTSGSIGVRGAFTADILAHNGVNAAHVIGCPTGYLNAGHSFRVERIPSAEEVKRCAVSFKRDRNRYEADFTMKSVQRAMLQDCLDRGWDYVVQANYAEATLAFFRNLEPQPFKNMARYFDVPKERREELEKYCNERLHIFFRFDQWRGLLEGMDFAFGSRFHGNMMALMAGVPAVWYTHDTRTEELCEALRLPRIDVRTLAKEGYSLERVLEAADYAEFNRSYDERCAAFDDYLTRQVRATAPA